VPCQCQKKCIDKEAIIKNAMGDYMMIDGCLCYVSRCASTRKQLVGMDIHVGIRVLFHGIEQGAHAQVSHCHTSMLTGHNYYKEESVSVVFVCLVRSNQL
jgi:hypothetical protein